MTEIPGGGRHLCSEFLRLLISPIIGHSLTRNSPAKTDHPIEKKSARDEPVERRDQTTSRRVTRREVAKTAATGSARKHG